MSWPKEAERELLADAGYRDFYAFCTAVLGLPEYVRGNPQGRWWTKSIHREWCNWLQEEIEEWERTRSHHCLMIDAHRRSGKTMIVTSALLAWLLLRDPNRGCVISAIEKEQGIEFADYIRNVLGDTDHFSIFAWLYGNWTSATWTMERFNVAPRKVNRKDGSIEVSSIETGITGKHPDVVVVDDPVSYEKIREKGGWLATAKKHISSIYPALEKHALFIFVGTPYTDGDPLTHLIRRDGIRYVKGMPLPRDYKRYVRPTGRWRMYHLPGVLPDGEPTIPAAWSKEALRYYQDTEPAEYAAQILLCPGSGDLQALTYEQIEECLVTSAEVPRGALITFHMDTAFKSPKRMGVGDWSTIIVAAHHRALADVYYLSEHGSNSWRDDDFIAKLVELTRLYYDKRAHIACMTDEAEIGGKTGLWRKRLQSAFVDAGIRMPRFLELRRGRGDNNTNRIASVAGYWIDGHVKLVKGRCPNLIDQMARIGLSEHDDFASAAADAFHPEVYRVFNPGAGGEAPLVRRPFEEILSGTNVQAAYDHWHKPKAKHFASPSPIR